MNETIDRAVTAAPLADLTPDEIVAAALEFEQARGVQLVYDPRPDCQLPSIGAEFDRFLAEYAARPERLIIEVDLT